MSTRCVRDAKRHGCAVWQVDHGGGAFQVREGQMRAHIGLELGGYRVGRLPGRVKLLAWHDADVQRQHRGLERGQCLPKYVGPARPLPGT